MGNLQDRSEKNNLATVNVHIEPEVASS